MVGIRFVGMSCIEKVQGFSVFGLYENTTIELVGLGIVKIGSLIVRSLLICLEIFPDMLQSASSLTLLVFHMQKLLILPLQLSLPTVCQRYRRGRVCVCQ